MQTFYKAQPITCFRIPTTHALVLLLDHTMLTFEERTPQVESELINSLYLLKCQIYNHVEFVKSFCTLR